MYKVHCPLSLRPTNRWQGRKLYLSWSENKASLSLQREHRGMMGWEGRARKAGGPKFPAAIVFWIHKVKLYSLVTSTLVSLYQRYAIYFISALNEKKKRLRYFSYNEGCKRVIGDTRIKREKHTSNQISHIQNCLLQCQWAKCEVFRSPGNQYWKKERYTCNSKFLYTGRSLRVKPKRRSGCKFKEMLAPWVV